MRAPPAAVSSAYLTYRELFTIQAICSCCASSAVLFTLLAVVSSVRVVSRRPEAGASRQRTRDPLTTS